MITIEEVHQWNPGRVLSWYLMCSFIYYRMNDSLVSDAVYDEMAKVLLKKYDSFEHQHKHLVTKEDLEAGTLYGIYNYPTMVRSAAMALLAERDENVS